MKTELYYFSGTGNGIHISKTIEAKLLEDRSVNNQVKLINIGSLNLKNDIKSNADIIGIIYPVYFLEPPKIVADFAKRLKTDKNTYLFLYTHYGAMYGNAIHTIKQILEKNSLNVSAVFGQALPDNSIIFPTKPELIDGMLKEGYDTAKKNAELIALRKENQNSKFEKKSLYSKPLGQIIKGISVNYLGFKKMKVDDNCNSCTLCSKVCPVKNINMSNNKPDFSNKCEICFACIHNCPKQSIKFKRMKVKDNYQYKHPEVKINELG